MAIFAANLSSTVSFKLRITLISTPWIKRATFIRFCSGNYQSSDSSIPIRYIPKNVREKEDFSHSKKLKKAEFENFPSSISLENGVSRRKSGLGKTLQKRVPCPESDDETDNMFEEKQAFSRSKNIEKIEFENFSGSVSLDNGVSRRKSGLGKKLQKRVPCPESDDETDNMFEEKQPFPRSKNIEKREFENFSGLISLENGVPRRKSSLGKTLQKQVPFSVSDDETDSMFEAKKDFCNSKNIEKTGFGDSPGSISLENGVPRSKSSLGKTVHKRAPCPESDDETENMFGEKQAFLNSKNIKKTESGSFPGSISVENSVSRRKLSSGKTLHNGVPCAESNDETDNRFEDVGEFLKLDEESDHESEEVTDEFGFACENEPHQGNAKWANKTKKDAEKVAIEALAIRAFTAFELQKKLRGKKFPPKVIDAVISDFRSRGLINDYLYAESFSQSRWSTSTWGPRRIKQALRQKGVSKVDAEKATQHVFESDDSCGDHVPSLGMSKLSLDRLFVQSSKQWLRGQDVPNDKRKSRLVRWLQYRGFNWGVISFILKKLESQYPS